MNHVIRSWIVLGCTLAVVLAVVLGARAIQSRVAPIGDSAAVVVLELYTSEGCSSCPPAEDVLGHYVKDATEKHLRVYPLEFHVDTWNQPAFTDPFSDAKYRERQEAYYKAGITREVFTPQLIVNGVKSEIGSDNEAVQARTDEALRTAAMTELSVSVRHTSAQLNADVILSSLPPKVVLNVALVERGIVHHIPKGENEGRTLHHENVVRAYKSLELTQPHASVQLDIPHDVVLSNCSVIAYVQNAKLSVLGASEAAIPAASTP
jgi:hypothetical protein